MRRQGGFVKDFSEPFLDLCTTFEGSVLCLAAPRMEFRQADCSV
jgi:hypothetical protein